MAYTPIRDASPPLYAPGSTPNAGVMKEKPKMYIVKKYIKATNALDAIRKDKKTPVHDVWVDDTWSKNELPGAIGFGNYHEPED